jgi:hypothetical protein
MRGYVYLAHARALNRIQKTITKDDRCRDNNIEILIAEGRRNVKCPTCHSWGAPSFSAGRGLRVLPAPYARYVVVEPVVSTACPERML